MSGRKGKEKALDPKEKKRQLVVKELYETEKTYKDDLETMIEVFKEPISDLGLVSDDDIACIFQNIEQLATLHHRVLMLLDKIGTDLFNQAGAAFMQMAPYFAPYREYCANHENADNALQRCIAEKPALVEFLDDCRNIEDTHRLNLSSFLIKPVQRICKYPLMFHELIKNTPESHLDYGNLVAAKQKLEEVAQSVNESKRDSDTMEKLTSLEQHIDGIPLGTRVTVLGRSFVHEGILQQANSKGKPSSELRGFVFNDAVLLCSNPFQKNLKFRQLIPMSVLLCRSLDDEKDAPKNSFELIRMDQKKITIYMARNAKEKAEWVSALDKSIEAALEQLRKKQLEEAKSKADRRFGEQQGGLVDRREWYKRYRQSCDMASDDGSFGPPTGVGGATSPRRGSIARSKTAPGVISPGGVPVPPPRSDVPPRTAIQERVHSVRMRRQAAKEQSARSEGKLPAVQAPGAVEEPPARAARGSTSAAAARQPLSMPAVDPGVYVSPQATIGRFGDPTKLLEQKQEEIDDIRRKLTKECKANAELRAEVQALRTQLDEEKEKVWKLTPKKKRKDLS